MAGALTTFLPALEDLRRRRKPSAATALAALESIIARGQLIAAAVLDYERHRATHVAVPFAEVTATVVAIETFVETYFPDLDYPADLFTTLRTAEEGLFSLQQLRLAFASQATATAGVQNVFVPRPAPLIPYALRQGDTIERMAQRFLGTIDRSWEILELNNLVYPFLMTERSYASGEFSEEFDPGAYTVGPSVDRTGVPDGVRVTGEVIWLPGDAAVPQALQVFTGLDAELFGRDGRLDDGEIGLSDDGQLLTVAGQNNIIQALRQRLGTLRGELVLHPEYGMEKFLVVGVEGTQSNVIFSGLEVARTVRQDPRVTGVQGLQILFQETVNTADMRVGLIGPSSRSIPFNLIVPESVAAGGGLVP